MSPAASSRICPRQSISWRAGKTSPNAATQYEGENQANRYRAHHIAPHILSSGIALKTLTARIKTSEGVLNKGKQAFRASAVPPASGTIFIISFPAKPPVGGIGSGGELWGINVKLTRTWFRTGIRDAGDNAVPACREQY